MEISVPVAVVNMLEVSIPRFALGDVYGVEVAISMTKTATRRTPVTWGRDAGGGIANEKSRRLQSVSQCLATRQPCYTYYLNRQV